MNTTIALPRELATALGDLDGAEEIRLRAGQKAGIMRGGKEFSTRITVTREHIAAVIETATQGSAHTAFEAMRRGYVTVAGGHRLGIGGTAVCENGQVRAIRDPSSVTVRIASERIGIADGVSPFKNGKIRSMIVISPPGLGKTTLLRDLTRKISDAGFRVCVADERGEIAALYRGEPQLDVGSHTDVLEGCPKAAAVMLLLRAHNPQLIVVDEITAPEDAEAMRIAAHCGVALLASAHGEGVGDLKTRAAYRGLDGLFDCAVTIRRRGFSAREYGECAL